MIYEHAIHHDFEISLGAYSAGTGDKYQSNLAYRYSPWRVSCVNFNWEPIQIGAFALYSWDRRFFLKTPDKYPTDNYYEQTAFRWGLEQGSSFSFLNERWHLALTLRIIDNGIVAIYNNANRDLQYYLSSGLRLEYRL